MTDNELKPLGLPGKIARIMGGLQRIPENGTNSYFKYSFVSADDVYDTVRMALAAEGIAFFASMIGWKQDASGKSIKTICDFEFTFVDADTGESRTMLWSGEANDEQDKGLSKAATSAEKYFLLKTFMISTGDKEDADSGPKPQRQQPQQQQSQNAQQATQPVAVPNPMADAFRTLNAASIYDMYPLERDRKDAFRDDVKRLQDSGKLTAKATAAEIVAAVKFDQLPKMAQASGK